MKREQCLKIIIWCSLLGVLLSAYMTYRHYAEGESFCNISSTVNCDIVNKSVYSVDPVFGIPVAILGMIVYSIIGVFAWYALKNTTLLDISISSALTLLAAAGVAFSVYLTYAEIFWLRTICPFCVLSFINIIVINVISAVIWKNERHDAHVQT